MKRRKNPTLVVLSNPTSIPDEAVARSSWAKFHLRDGRKAQVLQVPDVAGMPKTVVVLGDFDGMEVVKTRTSERYEKIEFTRVKGDGPWLVTDPKMKRLWVVAREASDLIDVPSRGFVRAIYYWPNENSGKYDPKRAYRHAFGDSDGTDHEDGCEECYPRLHGKGRSRALVDGHYWIEPTHGIIQ